MTVAELIEALQKQDPSAQVRISVSNADTGASSMKDVEVKKDEEIVNISAYVWSDDEEAWFGDYEEYPA